MQGKWMSKERGNVLPFIDNLIRKGAFLFDIFRGATCIFTTVNSVKRSCEAVCKNISTMNTFHSSFAPILYHHSPYASKFFSLVFDCFMPILLSAEILHINGALNVLRVPRTFFLKITFWCRHNFSFNFWVSS